MLVSLQYFQQDMLKLCSSTLYRMLIFLLLITAQSHRFIVLRKMEIAQVRSNPDLLKTRFGILVVELIDELVSISKNLADHQMNS